MDDIGARPRRRRTWIWLLAGVVVLAAVVVVALEVTSQPWFCASCHEMEASVEGWRQAEHKETSCFSCHTDEGLIGYLDAKVVRGLNDVWVHFTESPQRIEDSDPIPPARCLKCHEDEYDEGKLPDDHPERDRDCTECHAEEAHEPVD